MTLFFHSVKSAANVIGRRSSSTVSENFGTKVQKAVGEVQTAVHLVSSGRATVRQVLAGAFVGVELFAFFTLGECVGRFALLGYDIKVPAGGNSHH